MVRSINRIVETIEDVLPVFLYSSIGFVLLIALLSVLGYLNIKLAIPGYLLATLVGVLTYLFFKSKLQAIIPTRISIDLVSFFVFNVLVFSIALTLFQLYVPIAVTYSIAGTISTAITLPVLSDVLTTFVNAVLYSAAFYLGLVLTAIVL